MTAFTKLVSNYIGSNHSLVLNGIRSVDHSVLSEGRMFRSQPVTVRACNKLSKICRAIGLSAISNKLKQRVIVTTNPFANELKSQSDFERKQQTFAKREEFHSTLTSTRIRLADPKAADAQDIAIQRANTTMDQAKSKKVLAEKKYISQQLKVVNSQIRALCLFDQAVSLAGETQDRILGAHSALIDGGKQRLDALFSAGSVAVDLPPSLAKEVKHVTAQLTTQQKIVNQLRAGFDTLESKIQNKIVKNLHKNVELEKLMVQKQDLENRYTEIVQPNNSSAETIQKHYNKSLSIKSAISETKCGIDNLDEKIENEKLNIELCKKEIIKILSLSSSTASNNAAKRHVRIIIKHQTSMEHLYKQRLHLQNEFMALMGAAERLEIKMGKEPAEIFNIANPFSRFDIKIPAPKLENIGSKTGPVVSDSGSQTDPDVSDADSQTNPTLVPPDQNLDEDNAARRKTHLVPLVQDRRALAENRALAAEMKANDELIKADDELIEDLDLALNQNNSGETPNQKAIRVLKGKKDSISSHVTVPSSELPANETPVKPVSVFGAMRSGLSREFKALVNGD